MKIICLLILFIISFFARGPFVFIEAGQGQGDEKTEDFFGMPEYNDSGKKDPFIPLITKDGVLTTIRDERGGSVFYLQGIFFDDRGESMALINDQVLKAGEVIGSAKIVEIQKDKVMYIKDGEIFILSLFQEEGE